jgi:hypothetical protein
LRWSKDTSLPQSENDHRNRRTELRSPALINHPVVDDGGTDPMISVTRYCGTERSSIVAGIKSGLASLRKLASEIGFRPRKAVVIYRNLQPSSVTLEVGIPIPEDMAYRNTGEFKCGRTPGGPTLRAHAVEPGPTAIAANDALRRTAAEEGLLHEPYWWQVFEDTGDLDWTEEVGDVNLPVSMPR